MRKKDEPDDASKIVASPDRRRLLGGSLLAIGATAVSGAANAATSSCSATGSDILGPFHRPGAPFATDTLVSDEEPGERILFRGQVFGDDCKSALKGAVLDFWQADAAGQYDKPDYLNVVDVQKSYRLRRQFQTDNDGRYAVKSVMPGKYKIPPGLPNFEAFAGQTRPAHVHLIVAQPGYAPLVTQIYFDGDPMIADDPWAKNSRVILNGTSQSISGRTYTAYDFDIILKRAIDPA